MNKQIEELAEELLFYTIIPNDELCDEVAEYIINAGYRRQEDLIANMEEEVDGWKRHYESLYETDKATIRTEVAREIFAEIEKLMTSLDKRHMQCRNPKQAWGIRNAMWEIAELKKKYGVTDDGNF